MLERNVAVLLAGVAVALAFESAQRANDAKAGFGRFDHRVKIAALGGDKGIREAFAKFVQLGGAIGKFRVYFCG